MVEFAKKKGLSEDEVFVPDRFKVFVSFHVNNVYNSKPEWDLSFNEDSFWKALIARFTQSRKNLKRRKDLKGRRSSSAGNRAHRKGNTNPREKGASTKAGPSAREDAGALDPQPSTSGTSKRSRPGASSSKEQGRYRSGRPFLTESSESEELIISD